MFVGVVVVFVVVVIVFILIVVMLMVIVLVVVVDALMVVTDALMVVVAGVVVIVVVGVWLWWLSNIGKVGPDHIGCNSAEGCISVVTHHTPLAERLCNAVTRSITITMDKNEVLHGFKGRWVGI